MENTARTPEVATLVSSDHRIREVIRQYAGHCGNVVAGQTCRATLTRALSRALYVSVMLDQHTFVIAFGTEPVGFAASMVVTMTVCAGMLPRLHAILLHGM